MGTRAKRNGKVRSRGGAPIGAIPARAKRHWENGVRFVEEGNTLRAIEELERAIALAPRAANIYRDLAIVYDRMGLLGKSIEYYRKVLELEPDHLDAANDLACTYAAQRRYAEARELLERALVKHPNHPQVRENLRRLEALEREKPAAALPQRRPGERQRISLSMIVKNEEQNLPGCLASVRDLVDEIVIVDTGSTDRTVEIAREHGAKVYFFAWQGDFASARNESLRHCTGDWILYLDADERVEPDSCREIRRLVEEGEYGAYCLNIINRTAEGDDGVDFVHVYPRLFRNVPGARFEMGVHEQIYPSLYRAGIEMGQANVYIIHHGYALSAEQMRQKSERNLAILERQAAEWPNSSAVRYYLGVTYIALGRYEEGIAELRAFLALPDTAFHLKAFAHLTIANVLQRKLNDPAGAIVEAKQALSFDDSLVGPRIVLAEAYTATGEHEAAIGVLLEARARARQASEHFRLDYKVPEGRLLAMLGSCQAKAGRLEEAIASFRQAEAAGFQCRDLYREWALAAMRARRFAEAEGALDQAASLAANPKEKVADLLQKALVRTRLSGIAAARETLASAFALDPALFDAQGRPTPEPAGSAGAIAVGDKLRFLRLLSNVCREAGDWRGLAEVIRELAEAGEERVAVLLRMAEALEGLGRFEAAIGYLEKAIAADPRRAEAWQGLGRCYARLERTEEAEACLALASSVGAVVAAC